MIDKLGRTINTGDTVYVYAKKPYVAKIVSAQELKDALKVSPPSSTGCVYFSSKYLQVISKEEDPEFFV